MHKHKYLLAMSLTMAALLILSSQLLAGFEPHEFKLYTVIIDDNGVPGLGPQVGNGECSVPRPGRVLIGVDLDDDYQYTTTYRLSLGVQISPRKLVVNSTKVTLDKDGRGQGELKIPRNIPPEACALVMLTAPGEAIASDLLKYYQDGEENVCLANIK